MCATEAATSMFCWFVFVSLPQFSFCSHSCFVGCYGAMYAVMRSIAAVLVCLAYLVMCVNGIGWKTKHVVEKEISEKL